MEEDKNGSCTFEGRISTAGDARWIAFSGTDDILRLPWSRGTRPGKHCESIAGARIAVGTKKQSPVELIRYINTSYQTLHLRHVITFNGMYHWPIQPLTRVILSSWNHDHVFNIVCMFPKNFAIYYEGYCERIARIDTRQYLKQTDNDLVGIWRNSWMIVQKEVFVFIRHITVSYY